jgi:hypothetical protein
VFGVPVIITPDGVTVATEALPNTSSRPLTDQINKQMENAHGLKVRLIPAPPVQRAGSEVIAQSGSIEISYDSEEPTPVRVVHRVAYTQAAVNAVVESGSIDVSLPSPSYGSTGPSSTDAGGGGSTTSSDSFALDSSAGTSTSTPSDYSSDSSSGTGDSGLVTTDLAGSYSGGTPVDAGSTPDSANLAVGDLNTTGNQALVSPPRLAVPAASTLPADELTNVYVGFGFLAAAVVVLLPLRRTLTRIGR